ncbi:hypothetical protein JHK87_045595 [Glycine soja]|nr:hypothetical protein JHK87_045595 [Glycine soja]
MSFLNILLNQSFHPNFAPFFSCHIGIMGVHKSRFLIIMFLLFILVILLHLSSCRHISRGDKEKIMEQRTRTSIPFSSFPHSYNSAEIKDNKVSGFHTVSHTATPGGPNPLHN